MDARRRRMMFMDQRTTFELIDTIDKQIGQFEDQLIDIERSLDMLKNKNHPGSQEALEHMLRSRDFTVKQLVMMRKERDFKGNMAHFLNSVPKQSRL